MAKASTNEIAKVLNRIQGHDNYTVIRDFFEISAIAVRNNVDYGKERIHTNNVIFPLSRSTERKIWKFLSKRWACSWAGLTRP